MNKPPPSARVLATIYACSERSIRNYRAEGAPLHDPAAMFEWWASRKNLPKGAAAKGLSAIQAAFTDVVGPAPASKPVSAPSGSVELPATSLAEDVPAGAAHELRWLEKLAVEARRNLIHARGGGDPVAMKQTLDAYLKITESLRKFDNQVAAERRDAGEMVARAQIEFVLRGVIVWTRRGIEDFINEACLRVAECEKPEDVYTIIAEPLRRSLDAAVDASARSMNHTPAWVCNAMKEGL